MSTSSDQKPLNFIVAFCKGFGIGNGNKLPWHIKEDLTYFEITTKCDEATFVIMGRHTFFSIPENKRPLKDRFNVVITTNPKIYKEYISDAITFVTLEDLFSSLLPILHTIFKKGFVIGGEQIFKAFASYPIEKLYVTYIDKEYDCDSHFPIEGLTSAQPLILESSSPWRISENEGCRFRHLVYGASSKSHPVSADATYLNLLKDILENGEKRIDRTGTGTLSIFARQIKFDISESIPILTTKFVPWKAVVKELLWFLQGKTDAKSANLKIWEGNTTREFLDKRGLHDYEEGDIGPMYGFQWRHFGATYQGGKVSYDGRGIDQLQNVIDLLKTDPYSRRILMTTLNVSDLEKGCLHPCHGLVVQFYVSGQNKLSCHMYQRSVDTFLGLTWNILSYAILTYIIAKKTGMQPWELTISTGDTHLYLDHVEHAQTQLSRNAFPAPKLILSDSIESKDFEDITEDDFDVVGYFHHSSIRAKMSV